MGLPVVSGVAWQVCIWNADITKWWVESYQSLGVGGRRFDELVTVVDTVGCLDDNLWCHRWWRDCRTGDVLLSVMVILNMFFLYVYFVSGCNKAFIYLYLSYLITNNRWNSCFPSTGVVLRVWSDTERPSSRSTSSPSSSSRSRPGDSFARRFSGTRSGRDVFGSVQES